MMAWVCPICTFFISISKALDQVNDCGSKQSRENAIERESKAGVCSDKLVTVMAASPNACDAALKKSSAMI